MKFGYKVEIDSYCDHYDYPEEEYGSWSASYTNYFKKVTKTKHYPDVVSDIDFQVGQKCFLVWIEWSSGNSFGYSDRCSTEAIGIFKDEQSARELVKAIEDSSVQYDAETDSRYRFYCKTSDGQEFEYGFAPWFGYFERLDEVHLERIIIEK